jgi:orotidine-5'-phosphate decarboxylase
MTLTRAEAARRLAVALDLSDPAAIAAMARTLAGRCGMVKIGLEAFTARGPELVRDIVASGVPVFLDLKLHDIPNTVERAARNCARLGVAMLTAHAGGGPAMLAAAVAGARSGAPESGAAPAVIAVTVLTSLDEAALGVLGMPGDAAARVSAWAEMAQGSGCDGVVCSPHEAASLRAARGPSFRLVTPGIRPAGDAVGDQRRVATPAAAIAAGADVLVVGRPITAAPDPAAAAEAILAEISSA